MNKTPSLMIIVGCCYFTAQVIRALMFNANDGEQTVLLMLLAFIMIAFIILTVRWMLADKR